MAVKLDPKEQETVERQRKWARWYEQARARYVKEQERADRRAEEDDDRSD